MWLGVRQEIMFNFNCCIFTELQIVVIKGIITKCSEPDPHFQSALPEPDPHSQSAQHSKVSFVQPLVLKQDIVCFILNIRLRYRLPGPKTLEPNPPIPFWLQRMRYRTWTSGMLLLSPRGLSLGVTNAVVSSTVFCVTILSV